MRNRKIQKQRTYTLRGAAWLYAPGFLSWLQDMWRTDKSHAVHLFNTTWTIQDQYVVRNILANNCHCQEKDDDVVVTVLV